MPRIKACLFDMDGLLIDSERIYTETTELLLEAHGKPPHFPMNIKAQMMGRPGPEAAAIFIKWSGIDMTAEDYAQEQRALQRSRFPHVKLMPGSQDLLARLSELQVPVALATSSTTSNFALKSTNHAEFFSVFGTNVICGDDPRVVGRGKPAPDIFLLALSQLNESRKAIDQDAIQPEECLVLEDGIPGVTAGLTAGMNVLWVPDPEILAVHDEKTVKELLGVRGTMVNSLKSFPWALYELESR